MVNQDQDYLTVDEVAARYRTSPATVRYWRHIGAGPKGVKVGTRVLFRRDAIEEFDRELAELATADGAAEQSWPGLSRAEHHRRHRGSTPSPVAADLSGDAA